LVDRTGQLEAQWAGHEPGAGMRGGNGKTRAMTPLKKKEPRHSAGASHRSS
jgi:hypothetical protein